jgi:cyclic-di-AMP phosphodiesterase PgpH
VLLFVIGNITGITTSIQLIDLMRPDHPLQRKMQKEALGSYQHTLSVANLVEAAAEAIGANTLLARVGTLYHDVGKSANPGFFVENRGDNQSNPHEGLSPLASARIIRAHVQDGVRLARKNRIPPQIISFIPEHHGTTPIAFFLNLARQEAQDQGIHLDESEFYYEGPIPSSREAAILMLADGCESAVRANRPSTEDEIEAIVSRIIQQRIDQHQLDDSNLTLTDIRRVRDSFVRTLRGMYHPRVKYPGDEKPALPGSSHPPALPEAAPPQLAETNDGSAALSEAAPPQLAETNDGSAALPAASEDEHDEPDIEIRPNPPSPS